MTRTIDDLDGGTFEVPDTIIILADGNEEEPMGIKFGTQKRFDILNRDGFKCQYCGAEPGNDRMHADHVMPFSRGGSEHDNNLIASCDRCNSGKSDRIIVPKKIMIGIDADGWHIWKQWGVWSIKLSEELDTIVIAGDICIGYEYWFELKDANEPDWERHIRGKTWRLPHTFGDFLQALHFGRTLLRGPNTKKRRWANPELDA